MGGRGLSHLQIVWRDDCNITCPDASIHQGLDVQTDQAHFTCGGQRAGFQDKGLC